MELNRELSQRCWLEVMRFAQDDSFGCRQLIRYCPFIISIFNFLDALAPRRDFSRGTIFTSSLTSSAKASGAGGAETSVNFQLSIFNFQLSIFNFQFSTFNLKNACTN